MNDNVKWAMETIERAVDQANYSRQPKFKDKTDLFTTFYSWYKTAQIESDKYPYVADSRLRDSWLRKFWKNEPHLAGIVNSAVAIDKNRNWTITGPRRQVTLYSNILRFAEDGMGWRDFASISAEAFYTTDINSIVETGRNGENGPLRALYNVDSSKCKLTGNRDYPLLYYPGQGKTEQKWTRNEFFRIAALPSSDDNFHRLGFCSISRCIDLVLLLLGVYEYDLEQLGARAPKGLLLLQNIDEEQWDNAMKSRNQEMDKRDRDYYGGVAVIAQAGMDQIDAKLIALSNLPQEFDRETVTNQVMYGVALAFGYSADEFWPVQYGALGRSRRIEIHHMRATAKGGSDYVLGFQDKFQREIPDSLLFEFDKRDSETDMLEAQVYAAWAGVVDVLYNKGEGPLTVDEVRSLLSAKGIISPDLTATQNDAQSDSLGVNTRVRDEKYYLKQRLAENYHLQQAAWEMPDEPIVRYSYYGNKLEYLWERADQVIARSSYVVAKPEPSLIEELGVDGENYRSAQGGREDGVLDLQSAGKFVPDVSHQNGNGR